jgi:hypothetical protein
MTRFLLALVTLFSSAAGAQELDTPQFLVRSFQTDYCVWNDYAMSLSEKHDPIESMRLAEQAYKKLLSKYTLPEFSGEPIAYGSDPSYDARHENILFVDINEERAIVRTEFTAPTYSPIYEYELVMKNNRWYLTQIFLVDEDGRYPGL